MAFTKPANSSTLSPFLDHLSPPPEEHLSFSSSKASSSEIRNLLSNPHLSIDVLYEARSQRRPIYATGMQKYTDKSKYEENYRKIHRRIKEIHSRIFTTQEQQDYQSLLQTQSAFLLEKQRVKFFPLQKSTVYLRLFRSTIDRKHSENCQQKYDLSQEALTDDNPRLIGQGAFSLVLKATDPNPHAPFPTLAIKIAKDRDSSSVLRYQEMPIHEIAQAHSCFVPPLLTRFTLSDSFSHKTALVFPCIEGHTVFHLNIVKILQTLPPNNFLFVSHVFQQILQFLIDMKKAHLVYADLQSTNLLIGKIRPNTPDQVWVIDFGISFLSREKKHSHIQAIPVRSPEVFLTNKKVFSPSMDMWSFGCLVYELFMQKHLFPTRDEVVPAGFSMKTIYNFFSVLTKILPQSDFIKFIDWMYLGHWPNNPTWKALFHIEGPLKGTLKTEPSSDTPPSVDAVIDNPVNPLDEFENSVRNMLSCHLELAEAFITIVKGCLRLIPKERLSPQEAYDLLSKATQTSIDNFLIEQHVANQAALAATTLS